jgi:hypothetical protein
MFGRKFSIEVSTPTCPQDGCTAVDRFPTAAATVARPAPARSPYRRRARRSVTDQRRLPLVIPPVTGHCVGKGIPSVSTRRDTAILIVLAITSVLAMLAAIQVLTRSSSMVLRPLDPVDAGSRPSGRVTLPPAPPTAGGPGRPNPAKESPTPGRRGQAAGPPTPGAPGAPGASGGGESLRAASQGGGSVGSFALGGRGTRFSGRLPGRVPRPPLASPPAPRPPAAEPPRPHPVKPVHPPAPVPPKDFEGQGLDCPGTPPNRPAWAERGPKRGGLGGSGLGGFHGPDRSDRHDRPVVSFDGTEAPGGRPVDRPGSAPRPGPEGHARPKPGGRTDGNHRDEGAPPARRHGHAGGHEGHHGSEATAPGDSTAGHNGAAAPDDEYDANHYEHPEAIEPTRPDLDDRGRDEEQVEGGDPEGSDEAADGGGWHHRDQDEWAGDDQRDDSGHVAEEEASAGDAETHEGDGGRSWARDDADEEPGDQGARQGGRAERSWNAPAAGRHRQERDHQAGSTTDQRDQDRGNGRQDGEERPATRHHRGHDAHQHAHGDARDAREDAREDEARRSDDGGQDGPGEGAREGQAQRPEWARHADEGDHGGDHEGNHEGNHGGDHGGGGEEDGSGEG